MLALAVAVAGPAGAFVQKPSPYSLLRTPEIEQSLGKPIELIHERISPWGIANPGVSGWQLAPALRAKEAMKPTVWPLRVSCITFPQNVVKIRWPVAGAVNTSAALFAGTVVPALRSVPDIVPFLTCWAAALVRQTVTPSARANIRVRVRITIPQEDDFKTSPGKVAATKRAWT